MSAKYFKHDLALVESPHIGANSRIWAFAHVLPDARIGEECNICDHVFVENDVVIGDRVTVKPGVQIWDGIRIEDDVFIGPNATFTNDPWPRSRQWLEEFPKTVVSEGASIGANATILPGVTIGKFAMIGAGSVVTRPVPPYAVVAGNPARVLRYTSQTETDSEPAATGGSEAGEQPSAAQVIEGVSLDSLPMVRDPRGNLTAREIGKGLPFEPRRYFVIFDVPTKELRGEHAHKECHQLLVCLKGSVHCVVDDGSQRIEHCLDSPELALHIPPMIWGTQYKYSEDCLLLVLASHEYDPDDYIREYEQFISMKKMI